MLDRKIDSILCVLCRHLHKPIRAVRTKQMELYSFILSLVPFVFEKVRSTEAAYLMMSEEEIKLLLASELPCILEITTDEEDSELMDALEVLLHRAHKL